MKKLALMIVILVSVGTSLSAMSSLEDGNIDSLIQSHTNSLLSRGFVKKIKSPKVIAISDIENATGEKIDINSLMARFKNALSDEDKFVFSRAIAGSGGKVDTLLKDSRNLRNNEEFSQYTTKEKGELLAPDYSLLGKITKRTKPKGKNVLVEYEFLLSLIDLSTGVEVWNNIAKVSKVSTKDSLNDDEEFLNVLNDCVVNKVVSACQFLIHSNKLHSIEKCDRATCNDTGAVYFSTGYEQQAMLYYEKAASLGDYLGNANMAYIFYDKEDYINFVKNAEIACEKLDEKKFREAKANACWILGDLYREGKGVRQDYHKAHEFYKKACDLEDFFCFWLGFFYQKGQGVRQDYTKAMKYHKIGCKAKSDASCSAIGSFYEYGLGVSKDLSKAKQYYGKACDLGYQEGGCEIYKELSNQGIR